MVGPKARKKLEFEAVAADKKKKETVRKQLESRSVAADKKKRSSVVEWTPEEDDVLREQVEILGIESWTAIASKFNGKTSRQCRSRWFFCLKTDLKTGNWSEEEDKLLLEFQEKYGNRWTDIAKMLNGRTDNAVKNRYKALCRKRQALDKENSTLNINKNSKRAISKDAGSRSKKLRGNCNNGSASDKDPANGRKQQLRPKLAELSQNIQKGDRKTDGSSKSLAKEMIENMDKTSNDFQNLCDFFHGDKRSDEESSLFEEDFDIHLVNDLLTDIGNESSNTTEAQSETIDANGANIKSPATETSDQEEIPVYAITTPLFKKIAATIPSPKFSPSERRYLMKTLGIKSPSLEKTNNHSEAPSCRRKLVHSPLSSYQIPYDSCSRASLN